MTGKPSVSIGTLAAEVGLSINWLRQLADAGEIPAGRSPGGHRRFDVEAVRTALASRSVRGRAPVIAGRAIGATRAVPTRPPDWSRSLALAGLEEDRVWRDIRESLNIDTTRRSGAIMRYGLTEMLNNAIDHSAGSTGVVSVWADSQSLAARIEDDGTGVFAHLRKELRLEDEWQAVAELTKGKVTTMSSRHSGEGIFFTSKAVDLFQLASGRLRWTVDNKRGDQALGEVDAITGTTVALSIEADTTRELREVFGQFTHDHEFMRTQPVLKLFGLGMPFVARSEARRLLEGMDRFSEVRVDFEGVADVGQGFVDELMRVWPSHHPDVQIVPVNMNSAVQFMVRRGLPSGAPTLNTRFGMEG